ncbi:hypothetical protein FKM82_004832 [Ascaphus truei]
MYFTVSRPLHSSSSDNVEILTVGLTHCTYIQSFIQTHHKLYIIYFAIILFFHFIWNCFKITDYFRKHFILLVTIFFLSIKKMLYRL